MIMIIACVVALQVPDRWARWADFGEGSTVTLEGSSDFGKNKVTWTLKSKTAEMLVIVEVTEVMGKKFENESEVPKPAATPPEKDKKDPLDVPCPTCGKHKFGETKTGREKLKLLEKELECDWVENRTFNCEGKTAGLQKAWYSKEVPGWLVKSEVSRLDGLSGAQKLLSYAKK